MSEEEPIPTLESIVQYKNVPSRWKEPLATIIQTMQDTGFHTWGFVIYKGVYTDDDVWKRYMNFMKEQILQSLVVSDWDPIREERGYIKLLPQYLKYTIIDDPALNGASKGEIRELFREWTANRSVERDGTGADHPWLTTDYLVPRFSHCIYIDEVCLATLARYEAWKAAGGKGSKPLVACVLIDANCDSAGQGRSGFHDVEGCTRRYTGWMYVSLKSIPEMYNLQSIECTHGFEEFDTSYSRPPLIYPSDGSFMMEEKVVPAYNKQG